jgi:hypothetical protein
MPKSENKNVLLKFIKEKPTIDSSDYIESRIKTNTVAHHMMSIENASEIARIMLQADNVFEDITRAIISECGCQEPISFQCKLAPKIQLQKNNASKEIIHMGIDLKAGGHYAGMVLNHKRRVIYMSDSMGFYGGEKNSFVRTITSLFPNYTLVDESRPQGPQPTGGFAPTTIAQFKTQLTTAGVNYNHMHKAVLDQLHEITQYDELSQHHFCYIESFVYICHKLLKTPIGNMNRAPRERIVFIKKVVWGLIHKFGLLDKVPAAVRNYFLTNFPWYLKLSTMNNRNIPLVGGLFHIPNIPTSEKRLTSKEIPRLYKTIPVKITMPTVTRTTTLRRIIELASQ